MFRNREIKVYYLFQIMLGLGAVVTAFFFGARSGWLMLGVLLVLFLASHLFTRWRYREIDKLSHYLRDIHSGHYSLDVRDNAEGELSILKNEIYKVTNMLSEHANHLRENRQYLVQATSDISHQLKTPLTSMLVMVDLLDNSQVSPEDRQEFLRHIRGQIDRLDWLVSSLLKISRLDSGTVQFEKEKIAVKDLLQASLESLHILIDLKQIHISLSDVKEEEVIGDFSWLKEALINLLKNALEHSPHGGTIFITCSQNVLYTELSIKDQGAGIPAEDLPYIFQRFYRGKQARKQSVGIGLALAEQIIREQAGDIEVFSEVGQGTEFRIKLYKVEDS